MLCNTSPGEEVRLEDPFSKKRTAYDVALNRKNLSGYLCGTIVNVFPPAKHARIFVLQTVQDDGEIHRFDIKMCQPVMQDVQSMKLAFQDVIWISLRKALVEPIAESSKPYYVPMRVVYSEGIALRITNRTTEEGKPLELNTRKFAISVFYEVNLIKFVP